MISIDSSRLKRLIEMETMKEIDESDAQARFDAVLEEVASDQTPVLIRRDQGRSVVLLPLESYQALESQALESTARVLGNPRNAKRLLDSIAQLEAAQRDLHPDPGSDPA